MGDHRLEEGSLEVAAVIRVAQGALEGAGHAALGADGRARQRRRLTRQRTLAGTRSPTELLVDRGAMRLQQLVKRLGVRLLDGLDGRRAQDVPIAISVLKGDSLDRSSTRSLADALDTVPGVATTPTQYGGGSQIAIRGVSASTDVYGGASPTALYADSVPFGSLPVRSS